MMVIDRGVMVEESFVTGAAERGFLMDKVYIFRPDVTARTFKYSLILPYRKGGVSFYALEESSRRLICPLSKCQACENRHVDED